MIQRRWHRQAFMLGLFLAAVAPWTDSAAADDWPQWLGPRRDGIWREAGMLDKFPQGGPKERWRVPVSEGYSGPAVAGGKVFLTDRVLKSGAKNPANPFEKKSRVEGTERVLCLDEATGNVLWKHEYDCPYQLSYAAGPRTTPVVAGDRVYTLGAMGDLYCLDVHKGKVVWSKNVRKEYDVETPVWGFAASPLLDGDRLICLVGGKDSTVVAFDKNSGEERWRALSAKEPGYAPPVIYTVGGTRQLIIWHPEAINSLDPETGKVYWTQRYGNTKFIKAGLSIAIPRLAGDKLFLTSFYNGSILLKLNGTQAPTIVWRGTGRGENPGETEDLHSIISTPVIRDGHVFGVCSYGELRCIELDTGKRQWETHEATVGKSQRWGNAFLVQMGENSDRYVLFNELGDLILARLTPERYQEISRAHILEPTNTMAGPAGRRVIWSHPAFADRCVFARNDRELVCVSLAADQK